MIDHRINLHILLNSSERRSWSTSASPRFPNAPQSSFNSSHPLPAFSASRFPRCFLPLESLRDLYPTKNRFAAASPRLAPPRGGIPTRAISEMFVRTFSPGPGGSQQLQACHVARCTRARKIRRLLPLKPKTSRNFSGYRCERGFAITPDRGRMFSVNSCYRNYHRPGETVIATEGKSEFQFFHLTPSVRQRVPRTWFH